MKKLKRIIIASLVLMALSAGTTVSAQEEDLPPPNGGMPADVE
jgi:hypothetical protein